MLNTFMYDSMMSGASNGVMGGSAGAGAGAAGGGGMSMGTMGAIMGIFGAISSGVGSYFSAQSAKDNLEFQKQMAAINARMAETAAQSILQAGQKQAGNAGLRYGQAKGSALAHQAARGIQQGEGSAAEEIASIDYAKESDLLTINANAVRQAWAARTQAANAQNESLLKGTTADSISPFAAMGTSLLGSGSQLAMQWYTMRNGRG